MTKQYTPLGSNQANPESSACVYQTSEEQKASENIRSPTLFSKSCHDKTQDKHSRNIDYTFTGGESDERAPEVTLDNAMSQCGQRQRR